MALVFAPIMIAGYLIGLPYGPRGVAFAYSAMMTLSVIPMIAAAVRGTVISVRDVLLTVSRPLLSGIVTAGLVLGLQFWYSPYLLPLPRLVLGVALVLAGYLGMLLYVMGQKLFYLDILRGFRRPPSVEEQLVVPA